MNNKIPFLFFHLLIFSILFSACQSKNDNQPPSASPLSVGGSARASTAPAPQTTNKGKIEAVRSIPVYSRIAEQIVMLAVERTGQHVTKGQVVARLSDAALREKIRHSKAKLEKAQFQYQAILMGQGYKHDHLDAAPENIRRLARVNSGYNEAEAELHELEHQLSYCTITAPITGAVSQICNTLYGAAQPGEALFFIVDTQHLKVGFDVLENELSKYQMGGSVSVTTVAYPSEQHPATVSAISPVIDSNGMVHVEATLQPHPHLMPGMTAFITIGPAGE
jgi:RND family efflux transporter MFP subunit